METKFQIGDKVSAFGVEGEVVSINASSYLPINCNFVNGYSASFTAEGKYRYPIECLFADKYKQTFTSDGKLFEWNKEPSLKLIERPNKKVKKYLVLYTDGPGGFFISTVFYKSVDEFNTKHFRFKSIHLIKESEIEVEE